MAFRVEVLPDSTIEIMRPTVNGENHFVRYESVDSAFIVIKSLLRSDIAEAEKQRFVPQSTKEARKAYDELMQRRINGINER